MEKLGFSPDTVQELIAKAPSALKAGLPLGKPEHTQRRSRKRAAR